MADNFQLSILPEKDFIAIQKWSQTTFVTDEHQKQG